MYPDMDRNNGWQVNCSYAIALILTLILTNNADSWMHVTQSGLRKQQTNLYEYRHPIHLGSYVGQLAEKHVLYDRSTSIDQGQRA